MESCTVILNKADYVNKVNKMIDEGIASGKYVETSDTTQTDLKRFQDFLYRSSFKTSFIDILRMKNVITKCARF